MQWKIISQACLDINTPSFFYSDTKPGNGDDSRLEKSVWSFYNWRSDDVSISHKKGERISVEVPAGACIITILFYGKVLQVDRNNNIITDVAVAQCALRAAEALSCLVAEVIIYKNENELTVCSVSPSMRILEKFKRSDWMSVQSDKILQERML